MEVFMFKCKICNKEFIEYSALRKHSSRVHKIHSSQTCIDYLLNGVYPVCKCGCGERTKWHGKNEGEVKFNLYKNGHNSITNNNWGNNKQAQVKSALTRKKQYESGERHGWCYGLSKETDSRIKKLSDKSKSTILNDETELKRRSEFMKKQRKDGTITTLYKEKSSRWKGGVSSVQNVARNDKRLYEQWKYPILTRDGFKCVECGNNKDLHVHHNNEKYSDIIKKVMTIDDYENVDNYDVKKRITDTIIDYHTKNNVSGITLCKSCHNKLHPSLNF